MTGHLHEANVLRTKLERLYQLQRPLNVGEFNTRTALVDSLESQLIEQSNEVNRLRRQKHSYLIDNLLALLMVPRGARRSAVVSILEEPVDDPFRVFENIMNKVNGP
jgi:hypothetical protein